jgi:hypothetical protein
MSDIQEFTIFDEFEKVVLPLVAVGRGPRWHAIGTAFVVAVLDPKRALLMTAAHNLLFIRDGLDARGQRFHPTTPPEFRPKPPSRTDLKDTSPYVVVMGKSGQMALASMVTSWFREVNDVAMILVRIDLDDDATFEARFALDTRPIEEGCPVMVAGYPSMMAGPTTQSAEDGFRAQMQFHLRGSWGTVTQVCPQGVGIHKWPGFLVNFPFDSGMSGGPILDLSGTPTTVRGIVGGDLSELAEDTRQGSGAQAFASMLWPAMMVPTQLEILAEDGAVLVPESARFMDLARHGFIDDRGKAHEHLRSEERDGVPRWWWDPSE